MDRTDGCLIPVIGYAIFKKNFTFTKRRQSILSDISHLFCKACLCHQTECIRYQIY